MCVCVLVWEVCMLLMESVVVSMFVSYVKLYERKYTNPIPYDNTDLSHYVMRHDEQSPR